MHRNKVLVMSEEIEIAERDWLICGLLWVAIGTLASGPFGFIARGARVLFALTLFVHTIEALYVTFRSWKAGLSPQTWFLRTIVLGALALLTLETHLRKRPRRRLVR